MSKQKNVKEANAAKSNHEMEAKQIQALRRIKFATGIISEWRVPFCFNALFGNKHFWLRWCNSKLKHHRSKTARCGETQGFGNAARYTDLSFFPKMKNWKHYCFSNLPRCFQWSNNWQCSVTCCYQASMHNHTITHWLTPRWTELESYRLKLCTYQGVENTVITGLPKRDLESKPHKHFWFYTILGQWKA